MLHCNTTPAKEGLKSNCKQTKTDKELTRVVVQVFTQVVKTGDQLHDLVSQCLHLDTRFRRTTNVFKTFKYKIVYLQKYKYTRIVFTLKSIKI